jgi:hypothetical protein
MFFLIFYKIGKQNGGIGSARGEGWHQRERERGRKRE